MNMFKREIKIQKQKVWADSLKKREKLRAKRQTDKQKAAGLLTSLDDNLNDIGVQQPVDFQGIRIENSRYEELRDNIFVIEESHGNCLSPFSAKLPSHVRNSNISKMNQSHEKIQHFESTEEKVGANLQASNNLK